MKQNSFLRWMMLFVVATATTISSGAYAEGIAQVTGVEWTKSSEAQKKAYLVGVANIAEIEMAYRGTNQVANDESMLPRMQQGLKGQTLDSVREGLNKWYAANPGRLDQPVIQTIWDVMVLPGRKNGN